MRLIGIVSFCALALLVGTVCASPAGTILIWSTNTTPSGYLLCNGAAVSRTTYADLFAVIGTTYGTGDGSTTFNVPDMRSRYPIGLNPATAAYNTIGEKGGSVDHFHTFSISGGGGGVSQTPLESPISVSYTGTGTTYQVAPYSHTHVTTFSWGGGGASNEQSPYPFGGGAPGSSGTDMYPPFMALNYIIQTNTTDNTSTPAPAPSTTSYGDGGCVGLASGLVGGLLGAIIISRRKP